MKYLRQFGIILLVSFIAEIIRSLIPLTIPASIYGLIIMFLCLKFGVVKLSAVEDVGNFLLEIMPIMFVPPTVGLIEKWGTLREVLAPATALILLGTLITLLATGSVAQFVVKLQDRSQRK